VRGRVWRADSATAASSCAIVVVVWFLFEIRAKIGFFVHLSFDLVAEFLFNLSLRMS